MILSNGTFDSSPLGALALESRNGRRLGSGVKKSGLLFQILYMSVLTRTVAATLRHSHMRQAGLVPGKSEGKWSWPGEHEYNRLNSNLVVLLHHTIHEKQSSNRNQFNPPNLLSNCPQVLPQKIWTLILGPSSRALSIWLLYLIPASLHHTLNWEGSFPFCLVNKLWNRLTEWPRQTPG